MATQSSFELLLTELFENIITRIYWASDLGTLCLASRTMYQRVIPSLYQSWRYHGLQHSQKSVRIFLQTIIWRPDLAAHVRELDLREWGNCPELEYLHGCPWTDPFQWFNPPEYEIEERDKNWGYLFENYDFGKQEGTDEDYDDSDAQSFGSDSSEEYSDSDAKNVPEDELGALHASERGDVRELLIDCSKMCQSMHETRTYWDRALHVHFPETLTTEDSQFLQKAAIEAGLDRNVLLKHHASIYTKIRGMVVLIAHLLASLPNLQHLSMVVPEHEFWTAEQQAIQTMLENSFENENNAVLQRLETLHICSALRQSISLSH